MKQKTCQRCKERLVDVFFYTLLHFDSGSHFEFVCLKCCEWFELENAIDISFYYRKKEL